MGIMFWCLAYGWVCFEVWNWGDRLFVGSIQDPESFAAWRPISNTQCIHELWPNSRSKSRETRELPIFPEPRFHPNFGGRVNSEARGSKKESITLPCATEEEHSISTSLLSRFLWLRLHCWVWSLDSMMNRKDRSHSCSDALPSPSLFLPPGIAPQRSFFGASVYEVPSFIMQISSISLSG
jgi:hypothetical protein